MARPLRRRIGLLVLVAALVASACASGGDRTPDGAGDGQDEQGGAAASEFVAQVASYELVANADQRFLAGVTGQGTGTVVSFGSVEFEFVYLGTREEPVDPPETKGTATAVFVPVTGHEMADAEKAPKEVRPSQGLGVYEATNVRFDAAGLWGVRVNAVIDDEPASLNAVFSVRAEPRLPFPGTPAPRTENPTIETHGETSPALDSRAGADTPVPDPELHRTSIAAALAAGTPVVVVVSTPVFCVSRFCGPITDSVAALATVYGDRAAFVHLEVWEDFEAKKVSPAAREWVQPGGRGDLQEPWVFLVGGDGIVKERFDNVVGDRQLEDAVKRLIGA